MTTLAVYSNKGGVGKTTAAVNLAYLASVSGKNTLICDLDPQGATSYYLRIKPKIKREARGFAGDGKTIEDSIKNTDYSNLDLLPADFTHRNLDIVFDKLKHPVQRLSRVLEPLEHNYNLIILDCPSTINILAENIFNAADYLLFPLIPTTLAVRAYEQMLLFLRESHELQDLLERVYIFFSMVDRRKKMHRDTCLLLQNTWDRVLRHPIPYSSEIEKMGFSRVPVAAITRKSVAAEAFRDLWTEIEEVMLNPADKKR